MKQIKCCGTIKWNKLNVVDHLNETNAVDHLNETNVVDHLNETNVVNHLYNISAKFSSICLRYSRGRE